MQEATVDQIAAFKLGAAARYTERKVLAADADRLFNSHMEKMAKELGLDKPSPKITKLASAIRANLGR